MLNQIDGSVEGSDLVADEFVAASAAWRYDANAGQYIFNLTEVDHQLADGHVEDYRVAG